MAMKKLSSSCQRATACRGGYPCRGVSAMATSSRRDVLLMGGTSLVLASPLILTPKSAFAETRYLPVKDLASVQKAGQREDYKKRVQSMLKEILTPEDAPACIRLALEDAGTFDRTSMTGGLGGALILKPGALPAYLKPIVEKLKKAKAEIDAGDKAGAGPISWSDLIFFAGKVATQAGWYQAKAAKMADARSALALVNPWDVQIGRVDDADRVGPNRVPKPGASVEEINGYFLALDAKPGDGGFLASRPPFWEKYSFLLWTAAAENPAAEEARLAAGSTVYADIKKQFDNSRDTISRSDYEIEFAIAYNKLAKLGAKFSDTAYLYPEPLLVTRF